MSQKFSDEESRALFLAYKQGDISARNKLSEANQGLIGHIADKAMTRLFTGQYADGLQSKIDWEDLMQSGNIGLEYALAKFDPDRGTQFSTFAYSRIRKHILLFINSCLLVKTMRSEYHKVQSADDRVTEPESFQKSLKDKERRESRAAALMKMLELFPAREREILKLRFGLDDAVERSYKEIAPRFGLSALYVRNIYHRCLAELKIIYDRYEETGKIMRDLPRNYPKRTGRANT